MTIHHYATPDDLAVLSDAVEAHCRLHDLDGDERAQVASEVYQLYRDGLVDESVILDRLDSWQRLRRPQGPAAAA